MMDQSRLEKVLPSCVYSPTYVVRDFPIARYQGLQFVSRTDTPYALDLFQIYYVLVQIFTVRKHCPIGHYLCYNQCFFPLIILLGVSVLRLSKRFHQTHTYGKREQMLLQGISSVPEKVWLTI